MQDNLISLAAPVVGLVSGLIGAYVGLKNRALLAEVRKEMAELENRIIAKMDGTYVRSGECRLREENVTDRLGALSRELRCLAREEPGHIVHNEERRRGEPGGD